MSRPRIDDPDLPLGVIFDLWPATVTVFMTHGMACFGCPVAPFHTVVDACLEYQLDESRFRDALRRAQSGTGERAMLRPSCPCRRKPDPK